MGTKLAHALLQPINTSAIILLGAYTVLWGLWVLSPTWSVFGSAPLYSTMASIMPEFAWGLVAVAAGLVIVYGVLKPSYTTLTRGSLVAGWHWGIITVLYFIGDWMNTGGITTLIFCIYGLYIYLNIRVNKVLPEKTKKLGGSLNE